VSINYYGVATSDPARIGLLVEGNPQDDIPLLDVAALYRAFAKSTQLKGPPNSTLRWEDREGGYVFVDLSPTCALVTQGTGGSDVGIDIIIDVVQTLNGAGVNVWDPQQGKWFPGSPVRAKAKAKAKPKAKAKAKPKAKAKAKSKPKAKSRKKAVKKRSR
jgi:hypothetical protein